VSKATKLSKAAQAAAEVRSYQTDPDVIALRVERVRTWVDRLVWSGMVLGLVFTMANVQHFAARGATPTWEHGGSIEWLIAWLLDPMVSLVLIGVLMGEQVINRHQLKAGPWVRRTKWVALLATYGMNTWSAWAAASPALILLHSVPPAIVFCAAEAVTTLRHQITEAVNVAYRAAAVRAEGIARARTPAPPLEVADRTAEDPQSRTGLHTAASPDAPSRVRAFGRTGGSRLVSPNGAARTALRAQQQVDREAVVDEMAAEFREFVATGRDGRWVPDWDEWIRRTGRSKSFFEKCARAARERVFDAVDGTAEDDRTADGEQDRTVTAAEDRPDVRKQARVAAQEGAPGRIRADASEPGADRQAGELVEAGDRS
jgi:hypothetical protein